MTARIKKGKFSTNISSFYPQSRLERLFFSHHAACLVEVFRSLSFFTFFRGAACVGREADLWRLIHKCVDFPRVSGYLRFSSGSGQSQLHGAMVPSFCRAELAKLFCHFWVSMFVFRPAQFLPGPGAPSSPRQHFPQLADRRLQDDRGGELT